MTAGKNRVRLNVEQVEDRCTPSALGDLAAPLPVHPAGQGAAAASVRAPQRQVIPIRVAEQCFANLNTREATATGSATELGRFTGQGRVETVAVDQAKNRATVSGTLTVVAENGDKLFVSFSTTWRLSTGKGIGVITVTGGTGRYAGATGHAVLACNITADLASGTVSCNCRGVGILILPNGRA